MKLSKKLKAKLRKINRTVLRKLSTKHKIVIGIIIIGTTTIIGYSILKDDTPKIENRTATVVKSINDDGEEELFLERVESMKSGIDGIRKIVFGEETMRLSETFGTSSNNYVEVSGTFRVDYAIGIEGIMVIADKEKKEVIYEIKQSSVGVNSVMLQGDIEETFEHKSFGTKVIDVIPGFNKDEEIKENAIKQLLRNSKVEAEKFDEVELRKQAEEAMLDTINKLASAEGLNYTIKFVK